MKSYKVKDDLYLNELIVEMPEKEEKVIEPSHQYIIIDRSGSMWGELDGVIDTIINYVDTLPEGSTVSLGYFSGWGEYNLSVPYILKKERDGVVKTADSYRYALGMTNFTEVLDKIKLDCKGKNSSLFFFTDGCHNCGPFKKVLDTLEEMKADLAVSIFVGCGWINRENMMDMAKTTEGSFVQLNGFQEFREALDSFNESIEESAPGCKVQLPSNATNICSILGKNIVSYTKNEDNEIYYKASNKKKQVVYFCTDNLIGELTEFSTKDELCARTIIHNLIQTNRTPLALKVLDAIGDKYYIRKLYNTFTEEEYAEVENEILKSVFNSKKRYKEGQVKGYLPDDNAFCVLDALDIISNDKKAIINLNDPDFEYKKTSRAATQTDGSKLIYPKEIKANANNLKYHENRLNVNLNVSYQAEVPVISKEFSKLQELDKKQLNESFTNFKIKEGEKIKVNCIRNYNIILDGKLNTKKLVLSNLSKDSINKLGENLELRQDGKYILDLSRLSLINKSYLQSSSAKILADKAWQSFMLSNESSVLKHLISLKEQKEPQELNLDRDIFLSENCYIKNGMYQPPKEQVASTDEYKSYEFSISFKGYSKASASSVIKKIQNNGIPTDREKIVEYYYNMYKKYNKEELTQRLEEVLFEYKTIQSELQHAKFAIILINRGCMDEFNNREDMSLMLDISKYGLPVAQVTAIFKVTQKVVQI